MIDFLKRIPAVSAKSAGFLDELDDELKKMRLRLQDVDLSNLNEEERSEHQTLTHLANMLYFHFFQTRQRFLRKEISRAECVDLVNELIEAWAEAGLHPERYKAWKKLKDE